jgi:hypothetical protein
MKPEYQRRGQWFWRFVWRWRDFRAQIRNGAP